MHSATTFKKVDSEQALPKAFIRHILVSAFDRYDDYAMKIISANHPRLFEVDDSIKISVLHKLLSESDQLIQILSKYILAALTEQQKNDLFAATSEQCKELATPFIEPLYNHLVTNTGKSFTINFTMILNSDKETYTIVRKHGVHNGQLSENLIEKAVAEGIKGLQSTSMYRNKIV